MVSGRLQKLFLLLQLKVMFTTPIIDIKGIPEAAGLLKRRMKRLESFREPLTILALDFFKLQKGWMDSEGRGSWVELAPGYARWKRKRVGNKPKLQLTGKMYEDMTGESSGGVRIRNSQVTVRATQSGKRWLYHSRGLATGNKSGHKRPVRQVISPATRIRKDYWVRLVSRWAAGQDI